MTFVDALSEPIRVAITDIEIRGMRASDIETVAKIQRESFSKIEMWSPQSYLTELSNASAAYRVAVHNEKVVGFGGIWTVMDEVHITILGVALSHRGNRIGDLLLSELLIASWEMGATRATLEVRETNDAAQGLYRKYGFIHVAIRKAYYSDNGENADILWINDMLDPAWREQFDKNRAALGR
ncbi:MAG: ribosomal protein S18-alanine N-acetyltransferase [Armatimonadetes bacterium]|nr:ribosomal protein S18-alanine N-acetyltransferase [Armatimonadota bacterium]